MALQPKMLVQNDSDGVHFWVTDKTGVYSVDNEGGWGSPNWTRAKTALLFYGFYTPTEGDDSSVQVVGTPIVYDDTLENTDETEFQLNHVNDGWYTLYLIALKVSLDGISDIDSVPLVEDEFFYNPTLNAVYQYKALGNQLIEDYSILADDQGVVKGKCERLLHPKLSMHESKVFYDYWNKRKEGCDYKEALIAGMELNYSLGGANSAFYRGLQMQGQDIIENLLTQNEL